MSALVLAAIAAVVYLALDWRQVRNAILPDAEAVPQAAQAPVPHEATPVPPRRGEMALARARALLAGGHLHDALDLLGGIPSTDPQRGDADRLTADIQRQLLALAPMPPPVTKGPRR